MNQASIYHQEILSAIQARASAKQRGSAYAGTSKLCYALNAPATHQIAKAWAHRHADLTAREYRQLLDSLARAESANEFGFIGELLRLMPQLRRTLKPRHVARWLARAEGWAEVDSICQSSFGADELLANWNAWKRELIALSKSKNVHQRRASLVLLTKPVRDSDDARLAAVAFANIARLKREQHILITKAISWLLRALIKHHRQRVETYLRDHADSLPKIALRETRAKLKTGRKSGSRVVGWSNSHMVG